MIGSNRPISSISVKYDIEKMNSTAVLSIELMPALMKPLMSLTPKPAAAAATSGSVMNATGGDTQPLISTTINTTISTKPTIANVLMISQLPFFAARRRCILCFAIHILKLDNHSVKS